MEEVQRSSFHKRQMWWYPHLIFVTTITSAVCVKISKRAKFPIGTRKTTLHTVLSRSYAFLSAKFLGRKLELCKNMTNIRYELMSMMKSGNWYVIFGIKNSLATGPITSQYPTRPEVKKHSPSGPVFKLSYRYWLIEAGCLGGGWRWWWTVLIARSTPEDLRYSRSVAWKPRAPLCSLKTLTNATSSVENLADCSFHWKPWSQFGLLKTFQQSTLWCGK